MECSVAVKDYAAYLENIHALKGSAGSMGAQKLFMHCKQTLLHDSSTHNYIENLKSVNLLFNQTEDALSRYINSENHSLATGRSG
jgi:HPt (histidine-containing phosphotransfer) domain-containing protein